MDKSHRQRVVIRVIINIFTILHLFRTHIHQGTQFLAGLGRADALPNFRNAEVKQFDIALAVHKDIARLEVTVHDTFGMGIIQGINQLVPPFLELLLRELLSALHPCLQVIPLKVLHYDTRASVDVAEVIYLPDVVVVQFHHHLSLGQETRGNVFITAEFGQ